MAALRRLKLGGAVQEALMLAANSVFWAAVAFMVGANLYFGPRIRSERIAMQWGLDGKPTWHARKALALWGMVAFVLAVRLLIWAAMTNTPDNVHAPEIGVLMFSIIVAVVHLWILRAAVRAG
jgi:hypothetical protein